MPEIGTSIGIDAEAAQVYEEGRSVLGSLITRLIAIVQQIIAYTMSISKQMITYAGEHPLALTLAVSNFIIWMS
jgi:hypothetical protein